MGRVKLKIQKLENITGRQSTYSKRKTGLFKKARELSVLCDIDIVLLMFSPSGKPTIYTGQHSGVEEIIERYSRQTPQERAKRKLESLEALKKICKKSDHNVNIQEFLGSSYVSVEDLRIQADILQTQLSEVQKKLSNWTTLDKIGSIEHLGQMEVSLRKSLNQLQMNKENLGKHQPMEIQYVNEFQDVLHLPYNMSIEEQLQPLSWNPNTESQHMFLSNDLTLFPRRGSECSAGTSHECYSSLISAGEKLDMTRVEQENDILNEFNRTGSLNLQLIDQHNLKVHEQQLCSSYNFGLLNSEASQPTEKMNMQETSFDFLLERKFEVLQPGYDSLPHSWTSTTLGTCPTASVEEHLFSQHHCSSDDHLIRDLDHMFLKAAPHPGLIN